MYREIISLNGQNFEIWYEYPEQREQALAQAHGQCPNCNGFNISSMDSNTIYSLAACSTTQKYVGQTITITPGASGGTAPYTYAYYKIRDQSIDPTLTKIALTGTGSTLTYTLVSEDVGYPTFGVIVTDSCPTGGKQVTAECTLQNVLPACTALGTPTATCPTAPIIQGSPATFSASWTGGVAPFTVSFWNDTDTSTPSYQATGVTAQTLSQAIPGTVTQNWPTGTHTMTIVVQDSCGAGSQFKQGTCTFSVGACTAPTLNFSIA